MKVNRVTQLIEDLEIGEAFKYEDDMWIKTNASHEKAGYQCVELYFGNLSYLKKGTKVARVDAEIRVFA